MNRAVLLIGGNLGDRIDYINRCIFLIEQNIGKISSKSSIYETTAWGRTDQQDFLNLGLTVNTTLLPVELLAKCLEIETELDRTREVRWGERTMDVDIIFYNHLVIQTKTLEIPHPRYHLRNFVLAPLTEIIPNYICPELGISVQKTFSETKDNLEVQIMENEIAYT